MTDPLFWLVLSLLFVTASLTIVLAVAIPTLRELSRAARSAEKLFDTLRREFPPTLESIRLTGLEISNLTDDVSEGVQSAGNVVKQVDESLTGVRKQAQRVQTGTRSVMTGFKVAWKTFTRSQKPFNHRRQLDRLPPPRPEFDLGKGVPDLEELADLELGASLHQLPNSTYSLSDEPVTSEDSSLSSNHLPRSSEDPNGTHISPPSEQNRSQPIGESVSSSNRRDRALAEQPEDIFED